jgi:hypothetical protein
MLRRAREEASWVIGCGICVQADKERDKKARGRGQEREKGTNGSAIKPELTRR